MSARRLVLVLSVPIAFAAAAARAEDVAPPAEYTTVVRAPGGPPQPVASAVEADEARRLPGTGGDPSVAAHDLPGVARPAPGATGLVVWGAAPAETRVLFDGIEIPALYHFGGFRSAVGAELVGRVEVVPGAYGADYGRALGGLVRVERAGLGADRRLVVDANLLDTSIGLRAAAARGLRVAFAARASYLDATYGRYAPADATALFPIPRYADAQAAAELDVGSVGTLRAIVLTSLDSVRRNLGDAAPGLPERAEDTRLRWWRAGISYSERGDDDGIAATLSVGGDRATLEQSFGPAPVASAVSSFDVGLRARYRARLTRGLRLAIGMDALVQDARARRAGSLTVPAREGDVTVFGQVPGDDVNADTWSATVADIGPFVTTTFSGGPWIVTAGLRGDAFPVDGSRALAPIGATPAIGYAHVAWALDPRASIAYQATRALVVTAAAGLYHQPVDPADLSAVFGAPTLGPGRAALAALSAWMRLPGDFDADVNAYYRHVDDLAVRSPLPTPLLAQALVPDGHGRSVGVTAMVRHALARGTTGWLTYTLSRSERWTADGPVRLLDYDQTHVLTAVATHRRGAWTAGARFRYATGMPRTPVVGSFLDATDGAYQPIFGAQNSVRLPAFIQADVRVDRMLLAGPVAVTVYLDVQNVFARRNPEELVYARDFSRAAYLTGPPLLGLLGVRIES